MRFEGQLDVVDALTRGIGKAFRPPPPTRMGGAPGCVDAGPAFKSAMVKYVPARLNTPSGDSCLRTLMYSLSHAIRRDAASEGMLDSV